MASDPVHISQAAFDRLKAEHDDLVTRGRIDIARKIEAARELGDLSENGDYHAAKEEQGKMQGRINHLANIIENAVIVEAEADGVVKPGSVVGIRYEGDDDVERYLLGSIEERHDDLDVMSPGSPLPDRQRTRLISSHTENPNATGGSHKKKIVSVGE